MAGSGFRGLAALFTVIALAGCETSSATAAKPIQIKGSDTMVNLGQAWAEGFMKVRPDMPVAVTGGGSGTGITALAAGTCDIAQCSRSMKPKESDTIKAQTGKTPTEIAVGIDALVVAVNPENKVASLNFDQLSGIFQGKITSWKEVGGDDRKIVVLSRDRSSGTHVYFLEHVVRHGNDKGPEEYAASALMMPSSQAIADEVATNKDAIGYYGLGYLSAKNKSVSVAKTAKDTAILPSVDTAISGSYPISRSLFFYTPGEATGAVKAFIDYVLSDDGQRVVKHLDFVPLRAVKD